MIPARSFMVPMEKDKNSFFIWSMLGAVMVLAAGVMVYVTFPSHPTGEAALFEEVFYFSSWVACVYISVVVVVALVMDPSNMR